MPATVVNVVSETVRLERNVTIPEKFENSTSRRLTRNPIARKVTSLAVVVVTVRGGDKSVNLELEL